MKVLQKKWVVLSLLVTVANPVLAGPPDLPSANENDPAPTRASQNSDSSVEDTRKLVTGVSQESVSLKHILDPNKSVDDIIKHIKGLQENSKPQTRVEWSEILHEVRSAEEYIQLLRELSKLQLEPYKIPLSEELNSSIKTFIDNLEPTDSKWSPDHKDSITALAPLFLVVKEFNRETFEAWLELTRLDRSKLLQMCAKSVYFDKLDLLIPKNLTKDGGWTYLIDTLFEDDRWIGGDLKKTYGALIGAEQTPAVERLRRIIENEPIPFGGYLARSGTKVIYTEKKAHNLNANSMLLKKYKNSDKISEQTFEAVCMSLWDLTEEERLDAVSQFKLENDQPMMHKILTAALSLNDSDALLSYIRGGFVGTWRMYWDMKSQAEKAQETEKWGGDKAIQTRIREGKYRAYPIGEGGVHDRMIEALYGLHPDVPMFSASDTHEKPPLDSNGTPQSRVYRDNIPVYLGTRPEDMPVFPDTPPGEVPVYSGITIMR
jgi:hypothetical protein